jgi:hypothetical protein
VVADLGKVMSVKGCTLSFFDRYTWGTSTPLVYCISLSENGTDWVTVYAEENRDFNKVEKVKDTRNCDFGNEYKARYVRLTFQTAPLYDGPTMVFLGEFEIIGRKNPENAITATIASISVRALNTDISTRRSSTIRVTFPVLCIT